MGRSQKYKAGDHRFLVELPPDLNLDLHAFCEVHFNAPKNEITRRALRRFIDAELSAEPRSRRKFEDARAQLAKQDPRALILVEGSEP